MKTLLLTATLFLCHSLSALAHPLIVAHRGASKDAPENTLPAFKLAWVQGADAIEGDFQLTKDQQIVCIHDADTKAVASSKLVVSQSTLAELRQLDVGSYHGKEFTATRIPTIAEVFATVPRNKKIYIEIKCGCEIIPPLLKEIQQSGLKKEQIVIIAFDKEVIKQIETVAPKYQTAWLSHLEINRHGKLSPSLDSILTTLREIKADGFSSTKKVVDESLIRSVMAKDYQYHVWTVDDAKTARRFKLWGVNSITTNRPSFIRENMLVKKPESGTNKRMP